MKRGYVEKGAKKSSPVAYYKVENTLAVTATEGMDTDLALENG